MADRIDLIPGIQQSPAPSTGTNGVGPAKGNFAVTLAEETKKQESLRVSSHAQKRLNSSQVTLTDSHLERIGGAVERATEKGANQSLIMLDNLALVVSVKNRVVITAVDNARMKDAIFTNIDSVVIA
jgi:flagellar operon protein